VAIPTRTDQRQGVQPASGRRPIVLAQLPKVGAVVESQTDPYSDASPQVAPPEFALPTPQNPADAGTDSRRIDRPTFHGRKSTSSRREESSHRLAAGSEQPAAISPFLQLHAHLAPYAGLWVALALIASAGLLYWLLVGPTQTPLDYQEVGPETIGWTTMNEPAPVLPVAAPAAAAPRLPSESPPAQLSLPAADTVAEVEPGFQSTRRPEPLDFSRLDSRFNEELLVYLPGSMPELATLPGSEETTPTRDR